MILKFKLKVLNWFTTGGAIRILGVSSSPYVMANHSTTHLMGLKV